MMGNAALLCCNHFKEKTMRINCREVAKFFSGFETFHALFHAGLLVSGMSFALFGIAVTPNLSTIGVVLHGALAVVLGVYAWGPKRP